MSTCCRSSRRGTICAAAGEELYDISHEALIRNSTEYQAWLDDAKKVEDALEEAHIALRSAGKYRAHDRRWKSSFFYGVLSRAAGWVNRFTMRRYRTAAQLVSGDRGQVLDRIFAKEAVFDPLWIAERAAIAPSKIEREEAVATVTAAWKTPTAGGVDFSAEGNIRPRSRTAPSRSPKVIYRRIAQRLGAGTARGSRRVQAAHGGQ